MEIGGYFGLELLEQQHFSSSKTMKLNSARSSLEIILLEKCIKKVYIPFYTCEVILEPIIRNKVPYEFYNINSGLYPLFNFNNVKENELFIYTNYFGISERNVRGILDIQKVKGFELAVDNAQAFYYKPTELENVYYFNSIRKFFGVPDGSELYGIESINQELEFFDSAKYSSHLIGRINTDANTYYNEFIKNDNQFSKSGALKMSKFTSKILSNIDLEEAKNKRNKNFSFLHNKLCQRNKLNLVEEHINGPLVYPFLVSNGENLRSYLITHKIYIPKYWVNSLIPLSGEFETNLTNNLVALPIDQRYSEEHMQYIIDKIYEFLA